MTGYLTTHVLDTARGCPAEGIDIALYVVTEDGRRLLGQVQSNADGRTDGPILQGQGFVAGVYELEFHVGDYLNRTGQATGLPLFLDVVPIRFGVNDKGAHYHVPLLLSPFGYSTYRGS